MSKYQRSIMAQLRLGILPLAIETGRYTNIPVNERYCFSCKHEKKVEDEYHFVYECALYNCIRSNLIKYMLENTNGFIIMSNEEQFLQIMQSDNRALHKFIENAWNIRKASLYSIT